ncbi:unnamed protein product, partial [marine sediment metagenome]
FDTYSEIKRGATGKIFDWDLAIRGKALGMPILAYQASPLVSPYIFLIVSISSFIKKGFFFPGLSSMAVEMGVDALGFIFTPSPRQITPEKARDIISAIPPFVNTVGVFVNENPSTIRQIIRFCGLDLVQLHGDESPEVCNELMPYTIKAFRLKDESS